MTIVVSNNVTNVQVSDSAAARADRLLAEAAAEKASGVVPTTSGLLRLTSIALLRTTAPDASKNVLVTGYYADGDGGGGEFYAVTTGGPYTDNGGTIITPNGGSSSTAWFRIVDGPMNVKCFGAVGNGSHDDTTAIQAAIDYCTNLSIRTQTLYFPSNKGGLAYYKTTAPLVITSRLNIVGDGQFSTKIIAYGLSAGQYVINWDCDAAGTVYHSGIQNIYIGSNNGLPWGAKLSNINYMLMKQVWFVTLDGGIYITGTNTFSNYFEEVTFGNITQNSVRWADFTGGGNYTFTNCTFIGDDGVIIKDTAITDTVSFIGCNFERCRVTDLTVNGTVRGLTLSGCRSELCGYGGSSLQSLLIAPTASNYVIGLTVSTFFWQGNSGLVAPIYFSGNIKGFTINSNSALDIGTSHFVTLNGAGEAGVISGNYSAESAEAVDAPRPGVSIFNNYNSSGALVEYWGMASWNVVQDGFTPVDASGAGLTFAAAEGLYQRIGNMIYFQAAVQYPTTSNTAAAKIGGLPETVYTGSFPAGRSGANISSTDSAVTGLKLIEGTKTIGVLNGGFTNATNANLSGKTIYFSGIYRIA